MSYDKHGEGLSKIRTDRVFTLVNANGERTSYFWYFVVFVVLYQIVITIRRKRKAA
jgi:signal peptidase I